ncbi:hypothetical secretion protein [Oceanobacter sp. RED65]|uniref:Hypothetical secretion protein n=1 Tax=Bermanella marisrubri TaxID=207949 RepID=Q1N6D5_9GAMM|nr:hypothetical secretion protein [Oceanobacter sp. RED65] [Bermanella marisrubri]
MACSDRSYRAIFIQWSHQGLCDSTFSKRGRSGHGGFCRRWRCCHRWHPLFKLDDRIHRIAVQQAQNKLEVAIRSTKVNAASIISKQAAANEAKINLENIKTSTNRARSLFKRNLISSSDVENANANLDTALATYEKAKSSLDSAILALGSKDETNLEIHAAKIALEKAQLNLDYTTIKAPTR